MKTSTDNKDKMVVADPAPVGVESQTSQGLTVKEAEKREHRCYELFENARDPIYVHDLKGSLTEVNKAATEMVGYSREEILRMKISDFVTPEGLFEIRKRFREKLIDPIQTSYEVEIVNRIGARIPIELNSRIVYEEGKPVAVQGIARNLTDRKRMEREREAIFEIIRGVSTTRDLADLLKLIHESISNVVYAENCFVALCDQEQGTLTMQFFVDKHDPMPAPHIMGKSCAAYVFQNNLPLLITQEIFDEMAAAGKVKLMGTNSPSWLGVPLVTPSRPIGVLVVQHYENEQAYGEHDLEFLTSVGGQIAMAIERKIADDSLHESERRLRLATESSNTGLWDWDLRTNAAWFSREWKRQIGYEEHEISNTFEEWKTRIHPDDLDAMARASSYLKDIQPKYEGEFRFRHKDGSYRWIMARASIVNDAQGTPVRMLGSHVDITERKRAEEALRQSEERYRDLVENARDMIYSHDLEGKFTSINKAAEEITGYNREEALKMNFSQVVAPENADKSNEMMTRMLSGERIAAEELEIIARDGHRLVVEVTTRLIVEDGVPVGVAGIARDITERKRAEAELARLVAAVEQTADSIVITDTNGNIQYVNPAFERITGYSKSEAIGQNPRILKSGKTDPAVYEDLWRTITRGDIWAGQLTDKRKDGTFFDERVTISPVRDSSGQIVNYIAVKQDITQQTQLESQLRQSQKLEAIGQLAGGVAHDFNNLLTAILGYSDLSLLKLKSDDPIAHNIEEIRKAGERASGLTRQLLAFSRKQILEPQVLDLNTVVGDTSKMLRRLIGEDVDLTISLANDLGKVKADPAQIDQILMNLAVNARDAMPRGGRLTIETSNVTLGEDYALGHQSVRPGEYVLIAVSDTGDGMDAETQTHIFEPFFTTKGLGKGTGLGLSTIYGIVKQSGGYVWVYSELNVGTTFKVYLPRLVDSVPTSETSKARAPISLGTGTVLLVEDDADVRRLTVELLRLAGYKVLESGSANGALEIAREYKGEIDLLITDVVMPAMGGRELAERVRALRPKTPVLFMSGYTDDAVVRNGIMTKDLDFIQKPFTRESLAVKVGEVLRKRESGKQPSGN